MAGEFYGRSYDLNGGRNIDGAPLGSIWNLYLHFDGESETINAGESFTAGAFAFRREELEGVDEAEISWVIECGPLSAGTLELFSGLDPTASQDPNRATERLGSVRVDGEQTVVLRTASITVNDLYRVQDEAVVWVKCTSGTVELVQVKLRAWPVGGPRGAWKRAPAAQRDGSSVSAYSAFSEAGSGTVTSELYWDDEFGAMGALEGARTQALTRAQDAMAAATGQPMRYDLRHPTQLRAEATATVSSDVALFNTGTRAHGYRGESGQAEAPGYIRANYEGIRPPLPDGAGTDPREIEFESLSQARTLDGAPVQSGFGGWTGALRFTYGEGAPPDELPNGAAILYQHTLADLDLLIPRPDGTTFDVAYKHRAGGRPTPLSPGDHAVSAIDVPLTGGPILALTITVPGFMGGALTSQTGPIEYTAPNTGRQAYRVRVTAQARVDGANSTFTFKVAWPEFEYYDPTADPEGEDEPTPRFFWKDDLDNWRAIGPGKPADDLVLFKIKTAMGIYSEPAPGEDAGPGAHPLRVKVAEGRGDDSWDTPVWMQPEW